MVAALSAGQIGELAGTRASATSAGGGDVVSIACSETGGSTLADASGKGSHATLRRTWGLPSHPGFLAAYPETQFIELESRTTPDYHHVWAPYYTAHKILKGLLDAYTATKEPKALDLAVGLCDWMYSRLSAGSPRPSASACGGSSPAASSAASWKPSGDPRALRQTGAP